MTKPVVLLTAAGSGMGAAIARKPADLNYRVATGQNIRVDGGLTRSV